MAFRQRHPIFRRRKWFLGRPIYGSSVSDIGWFRRDGSEMTATEWSDGFAKSLGVFLNGEAIPDPGPRGERVCDDSFLLLFNAHHAPVSFTLAPEKWGVEWTVVIDTTDPLLEAGVFFHKAGEQLTVGAISAMVLRRIA
jgi:isoamylase